MSGHVLIISKRGAKTPHRCRLAIPAKLSFKDLHLIIQTAFGLEDNYSHIFSFPNQKFTIMPAEDYQDKDAYQLPEQYTDLDYALKNCSNIFYNYGSEKYMITKEDASFDKEHPEVLSFEGDETVSAEVLNQKLRNYRTLKGSAMKKKVRLAGKQDVNEQLYALYEFMQKWQEEEMAGLNGRRASLITDLTVEHTDISYRDMLLEYTEENLDRMCRFLDAGISEGASRKEKADAISEIMHDEPELFLYLFNAEDLKWIRDMLASEDGEWLMLFNADYVAFPLMYGAITFEVRKTKNQWLGVIHPASDFASMLESITPQVRNQTWKMLEKLEKQIFAVLNRYGVMNLEKMTQMIKEQLNPKADAHMLNRVIRMHLALPAKLYSGHTLDGRSLVSIFNEAETGDIALRADKVRVEYHLTYRPCTGKELKQMMYGPAGAFASWKSIRGRLLRDGKDQHKADELINQMYRSVVSGMDLRSLVNNLEKNTSSIDEIDRIKLWYLCVDACLDTPQAILSGWSYRELIDQQKISLDKVFEHEKGEKKTSAHTSIRLLSPALQEKAYLCMKNNDQMLAALLKQEKYKDLQLIADSVQKRS